LLGAVLLLCTISAFGGQWTALGPEGGDVRSLSPDPQNHNHIFLGTSTGTIFVSTDGGHSWARQAHLGNGSDYVIDHIVIDPQHSSQMYAATWSVDNQEAGDLFHSQDGGNTWETISAMHGKSIRALAIAAYDSKVLVAGALDGVFRSADRGNSWQKISSSNQEIHNIESLALDPQNPDVVYAGTWHLAWKTSDAGATWQHINKGMIDDSDVFSVIVDHDNPQIVFASACSGIYKSESAGNQFSKIQGIPFSARRTRVLRQDPSVENIVYAGTTEGLWKTTDLGKSWKRVTSDEVVVNDVFVDPRDSNHLLIATDRSGVMASTNGAATWETSNHGYAHRYVSALLADNQNPNTLYVGVVNDREYGGVFFSRDNGQHWMQKAAGLGGRDVFALKQTANGSLVAGTNRGVFYLDPNSSEWHPMNVVAAEETRTVYRKGQRKPATITTYKKSELEARVNDLELDSHRWLAATTAGIYTSIDHGKIWKVGHVPGAQDFVTVRAHGDSIVAATHSSVMISNDAGATWQQAILPSNVLAIRGAVISSDGQFLVAAREGVFRSNDGGLTWEHVINGLPAKDITSVGFDPDHALLLATSDQTGVIFESRDGGATWQRGPDTGYPLRRVSIVGGHFIAATPFDGVVLQPEDEPISASATPGASE
jgi:photosystem II stability/assembly factor-like uncharacterized protein